ncbi:MAG TPA: hypothetical protein VKB02_15640 [Pyrinomonadaceae bacterium]|nr:hypothetical protein [Pyrinomonadaceae bacterium]
MASCPEQNLLLDKNVPAGVDSDWMELFSNKAVRLLLAVSVSIWMAGGCLFGCSNNAVAAETTEGAANVVEAGESCHAKRSHDCCTATKPKPKKRIAANLKQQPAGVPSFLPTPRGMMNDCPLVVNSTAVTSKSSAHVPDPGRGPVAALPNFEKQIEHANNIVVVPFLPNRGPTHLRCCVFLI